MNAPDEEVRAREAAPEAAKPTLPSGQRPEWLKRMFAADSLEEFLGVPRGGHRDPSPGEVRPRWPNP